MVKGIPTLALRVVALALGIAAFGAHAATLNGSWDSKYARYVKTQPFAGTPTTSWQDAAWAGDRLSA